MSSPEDPGSTASEEVEAVDPPSPAADGEDEDAILVLADGTRVRYSAPDTQLLTLVQAAEICNVSVKAMQRRWDRGQFEGASRVREEGKSKRRELTVGSLRKLGIWPETPALRDAAGLSPAEQREELARVTRELALRDESYERLREQMEGVMQSVAETSRQIGELLDRDRARDAENARLQARNAELEAKLREPLPIRDRLRTAITGRRR